MQLVKILKNTIHEGKLHIVGAVVGLPDDIVGTLVERGHVELQEREAAKQKEDEARIAEETKLAEEEKLAQEKLAKEEEDKLAQEQLAKAEAESQIEKTAEEAKAELEAAGSEGKVDTQNPPAPQA